MDEFLEKIKLYLQSSPYLIYGDLKNFIYTQLISYNLGHNQKPFKDMGYLFNYWTERNKSVANLETFVSKKYPYFCQFLNSNARNLAKDAIKLYIPLDENHLAEGANQLFDFIAKEGIEHNSKIGKEIRNDNIVVRVANIESAEKIIDFVKNNSYIQEGLLNLNPFIININGIGIAKDGFHSYNSEFCNYLAQLIIILKEKNRLNDLNVASLKSYLEEVKNFSDVDLKVINSLQKEVLSGKKLELDDFKKIIEGKDLEIDKESILKSAIQETYNKYDLDWTINALVQYRYNGSTSGFTRDNNARINLQRYLNFEDLEKIFAQSNIRSNNFIHDYIVSLVSNKYDLIIEAYKKTYNKYGQEQARIALGQFLLNGETKYITNNNKARDNLSSINSDEIKHILAKNLNLSENLPIEELIDNFFLEIEETMQKEMH